MRKKRVNYTPPEKMAILKRHLLEKVPVSDLCDELDIQPTRERWSSKSAKNGRTPGRDGSFHRE